MDIIPYFYYVGAIVIGGLCFFFLNLTIRGLLTLTPQTSIYFNALLSLFSMIPAVVLFRNGIRLTMDQQKRRL